MNYPKPLFSISADQAKMRYPDRYPKKYSSDWYKYYNGFLIGYPNADSGKYLYEDSRGVVHHDTYENITTILVNDVIPLLKKRMPKPFDISLVRKGAKVKIKNTEFYGEITSAWSQSFEVKWERHNRHLVDPKFEYLTWRKFFYKDEVTHLDKLEII